jgi:oligoribonuclease
MDPKRVPPSPEEGLLVWLDIETTGLKPRTDSILEIAAVVTSDSLEELAFYDSVIRHDVDTDVLRSLADSVVSKMHEDNGLWLDVAKASSPICDVMDRITDMTKSFLKPGQRVTLAGNSIHFDREFLKESGAATTFFSLCSHRHLDVSAIKEAVYRWAEPRPPKGDIAHRALADCRSSIAEMSLLRKKYFQLRTDSFANKDD